MIKKSINKSYLQNIGNIFRLPGDVKSFNELHDGTSNTSYVVTYSTGKQYVFQEVSLREGVKSEAVMKNVDLVTEHLRKKNLTSLHYHHTNLKENYTVVDGVNWRVLKYFGNATLTTGDKKGVQVIGHAVASFQAALLDFDVTKLEDTFGDRHATRDIFEKLKKSDYKDEIKDYLLSIEDEACLVYDSYKLGKIPTRVAHNHSKVQNVLFKENSQSPLVMIDLDAVMPGISLYDMATGAMSACRVVDEESSTIDLEKLELYLKGYLSLARTYLTDIEISFIPDALYGAAAEATAFNLGRYIENGKERRLLKAKLYAGMTQDIDAKRVDIAKLVAKAMDEKNVDKVELNAFERDTQLADQKEYKVGGYMPIIMPHKVTVKGGKCYAFFKRAFDIFASLMALIVLSPVLLIVGLLVVCTSKGPMIYVSKRVGQNGRIFYFYKFRSMYKDAEKRLDELLAKNEVEGGITFKMKDDPRITPFGKFIRKTSLDELPQLVNILKGDMSIIGPRVGLPREIELYPEAALDRLLVPQGLSGEWQANGRSDTTFDGMIKLDLEYVTKKRGFWHDIGLIFKTIWVVLTGKGAE